jgi:hypothetical protein
MAEEKRPRRRRGRRGRGGQQAGPPDGVDGSQSQPEAQGDRPARRDTRRGSGGPPSPSNSGAIRRSPSSGGKPQRDDGRRRSREDAQRQRNGPRERSAPRVFEPIVPQDETSIALGAAFREAQTAMRDARKALDKRKAEQGDEPDWLLEQLHGAEQRFEEAATAWSDHLSTTGRKVVRR